MFRACCIGMTRKPILYLINNFLQNAYVDKPNNATVGRLATFEHNLVLSEYHRMFFYYYFKVCNYFQLYIAFSLTFKQCS